jgi:hypothetical protein
MLMVLPFLGFARFLEVAITIFLFGIAWMVQLHVKVGKISLVPLIHCHSTTNTFGGSTTHFVNQKTMAPQLFFSVTFFTALLFCIRISHRDLSTSMLPCYDYIIVGGGVSGLVVANR